MNQVPQQPLNQPRRDDKPWYKQFWPWFIIAFPLTSIIASLTTLWIAISHPDRSVLNDAESRALNNQLKAQPATDASDLNKTGTPDTPSQP